MELKTLTVLTIGYFVYLVVGAAVFYSIERPLEVAKCKEAKLFKQRLKNYTKNNFTDEKTQMDYFIMKVNEYSKRGISLRGEVNCPNRWDFQSSVFFSGTIITTIGYGHMTPTAIGSQAFCVIYALLGIPIFAVMFSGFGELFGGGIKRISARFDNMEMEPWLKNMFIFSVFGVIGFTLFCCIPAVIFSSVEKWPYTTSMYFSIITLTTIGFGDYVAGDNPDRTYISLYRVMVYFWILFGLAFMATFVNIISDRMKQHAIGNRSNKAESRIKSDYVPPDGAEERSENEDEANEVQERLSITANKR